MKRFGRYLLLQTLGFFGVTLALAATFVFLPPLQTVLLGDLTPSIAGGALRTQAYRDWSHSITGDHLLILGNSTTLYSLDPTFLIDEAIPHCFSLASNGQTLKMSLEVLKWATRLKQPRRLVLDLNEEMCWNPGTESAFDHIQNNPRALDREFAALCSTFSNTHMALCTVSKGASLLLGPEAKPAKHTFGHVPKFEPPTGPVPCESSLVQALPENQKALESIIHFCQRKDIELTLIHHPRLNDIRSNLLLPRTTPVIEGMNWPYAGVDTMYHDDHHLRSAIAPLYSQWVAEQLQNEE